MIKTNTKRHIGVVTTSRSDFGLLVALIEELLQRNNLSVSLYATGMHHSEKHGATLDEIRAQGFAPILVEVPGLPKDDTPGATGEAMACIAAGFNDIYRKSAPDILVVMGDRMDMLPAVTAALPHCIPIAHISGGELSEMAVDDAVRHAVTKLSHLHFVSHEQFANRVRQMGEEDWRITVSGEPGLDNIAQVATLSKAEIFGELGLDLTKPVSVLTFHPETLGHADPSMQIGELLDAAARIKTQLVFTYPGNEPGSDAIITAIDSFCDKNPNAQAHSSLGRRRYLNLLRHADCVIGNSSSGLVEAASFQRPVVNVGDRQKGRMAPENVISVAARSDLISEAWQRAMSPEFKQAVASMSNPYGDGKAAQRICDVLAETSLGDELLIKVFQDVP